MTAWRGVNLGGWLVLERWMQESLFAGSDAVDEYGLCSDLGRDGAGRLRRHHERYIQREDLAWLDSIGINAVRIPVGYWVLAGDGPYVPASDILDAALTWCDEFELSALVDLHGLPGGQSAEHHTGRAGVFRWHREGANVERSLDVLEELAAHCSKHPSLAGIEVVNEPAPSVPAAFLLDYFARAYGRIRRHCLPSRVDVVITAFPEHRLPEIHGRLPADRYARVVTDLHYYQCFGASWAEHPLERHLAAPLVQRLPEIRDASRRAPVIVGEWSLRLPWTPIDVSRTLPPFERDVVMRAFAATQLRAYEESEGWFFWTYRAENEPEWSFREGVERGWLPSSYRS